MTTEVRDSGGLHKYRTEIPNMVLDMGLDAYTFRLYCHLKRVAGDEGMCWQSTRTISEATNMSVGQVSKSKKVLEEKGLIMCERGGPTTSDSVTIIDLWLRNMEAYSKRSQRSPDEHERSPDEHERSPHEPKKNHSKKNQVKNSRGASEEAPEATKASQLVAQWCERIDQECSGIYSDSEKGRFARDVGKAINRGVGAEEIDEAIDRIVERWDSIHLPLSEAMKDVSNGRSSGRAKPESHTRDEVNRPSTQGANTTEAAARRAEGYEWMFEGGRHSDAEVREYQRRAMEAEANGRDGYHPANRD